MPVAKPRSYDSLDAMKLGQKIVKPEEGNDSLDNFIRHAIGKEPVLSFSRAGDSPVQWIQLLHALDQQGTNKLSKGSKVNNSLEGKERSLEHFNGVSSFASGMNGVKESVHSLKTSGVPVKGTMSASEHMQTLKIPEAGAFAKANGEPEKYLSGWPLLSPPKIQMQKCDKCAREFCSSINYRRHIRVHRRSLNIDKDSSKYRNFLKAFWDKLSLDEAKDIISFKDVMLEEVPGSSIVRSLMSFIRKPGFSPLPQVHVKAGAALLDLVQSRASRFPITSQELFSILDDASERTFLCPGTAMSMQKFVFDGEPGKVGLEIKNLIACTCFLVEQKLVKAWLADKDAEALRCHKLLVEEEEAAQRRQTELLERKRLKKLRQKEQRAKEQVYGEETVLKESVPETLEGLLSVSDTSIPLAVSNSHSDIPEATTAIRLQSSDEETDAGHLGFDNSLADPASDHSIPTSSANCHSIDRRMQQEGGQRHLVVARRPLQNSQRVGPNGVHSSQVPPVAKLGTIQKQGIHRDHRAAPLHNGHKVWTRKAKPEKRIEDLNGRVRRDSRNKTDQDENCEVLIGSIPVTLGDCNGRRKVCILDVALDHFAGDHQTQRRNSVQEKPVKSDSSLNGSNRSTKLWRPVGRLEDKREVEEAELDVVSGKAAVDLTPMNESCLLHDATYDCCARGTTDSSTVLEEGADLRGLRSFSSHAAQAFLSQRWKEAIAADHVKLVLTVETEPPPGCPQSQRDEAQVVAPVTPECCDRTVLCSAENRLSGVKTLETTALANGASTKTKFRGKPEKGSYMLTDNDGSRSRTGGLSVSLSGPDGRVIGGGVGGMLVAATPVQVIVGSFMHSGSKTKTTAGTVSESGVDSDHPSGDKSATPTSIPPSNQNLSSSSGMSRWPGSRSLDMRGPPTLILA